MGIFVGTLVLADLFMESGMPAYLSELIVNRSRSVCLAMLFLCALTSFISVFVENVPAVLIVAPIALSLAKRLKINPVNLIIAIAISSNLQGTATLTGDSPGMLLAGVLKLNFVDFFFYHGRPSIFFAVQAGAVASLVVLYWVFRKQTESVEPMPVEQPKTWVPTWILIALIVCLAFCSYGDKEFLWLAGTVCMAFAAGSLVWDIGSRKGNLVKRVRTLDWGTALFLAGVFVLVGALETAGWIGTLSHRIAGYVGGNVGKAYFVFILISVAASAFIDNVPLVATMLPVAVQVSADLGIEPTLLCLGLLIGASLGGNISPIGAAANIVAVGILKKQGHAVGFGQFVKLGLPFTIAAAAVASAFIWLFWHP